MMYSQPMAGRPSKKKPSPQGERLARLRTAAGLSQAELAEAVGIPQRTLSHYERSGETFPAALLVPLSLTLGVTLEELLGVESASANKRGPKSKLERQFEKIRQLPKSRQQFIGKLLDEILSGKG